MSTSTPPSNANIAISAAAYPSPIAVVISTTVEEASNVGNVPPGGPSVISMLYNKHFFLCTGLKEVSTIVVNV